MNSMSLRNTVYVKIRKSTTASPLRITRFVSHMVECQGQVSSVQDLPLQKKVFDVTIIFSKTFETLSLQFHTTRQMQ